MPVLVKHVIVFQSTGGYGWTETHYKSSASETPDLQVMLNNAAAVGGILLRRSDLLGEDSFIKSLRVSYPRAGAVASQSRNTFLQGQAGEPTAAPALSLAWSFFDTTKTRRKITHLRGFWDSVEKDEVYFPNGGIVNGWQGRLDAYKASLIAGAFGWPSKDAAESSRGVVSGYVENADGSVTFTVSTDGGKALVANQLVTIRFSRINHSESVLNRALLCKVLTPTTVKTAAPIAAGPFNDEGRYNLRVPTFVGYSGCSDPVLGQRRMGAPLGHYPGRAQARPRV